MRLNLENCEIENQYSIYFLRENGGKVQELEVGRIFTDERGRGKADIAISLKDLELKGFPIDNVDGIIIKRDNKILLSGYINKSSSLLERYIGTISVDEAKTDELELHEELEENKGNEAQENISQYFPVGFLPGGLPVEQHEEVVEEKAEGNMEEVEERVEEFVQEEVEEEKQVQEVNQLEEEINGQDKVEEDIIGYQEDVQNVEDYQLNDAYRAEDSTYEQIEYIAPAEPLPIPCSFSVYGLFANPRQEQICESQPRHSP